MIYKNLFKKIPKNAKKLAIYGAGTCGIAIENAIKENLKDVSVEFFLDLKKNQDEKINVPIYHPEKLPNLKDSIDLIIISVWSDVFFVIALLNYYNIPYLIIPRELEFKIRNLPYKEKYEKAKNIFSDKKSKKLYELLWQAKINNDFKNVQKYVLKNHNIKAGLQGRNYNKQYHEYINKDSIRIMFDCGFFNGVNALNFIKNFPNLEKEYAFEPFYSEFRSDLLDFAIQNSNKVQIVPYAVWDKKENLSFCLSGPASRAESLAVVKSSQIMNVETIALDEAKNMLNVQKVDFIKMDIEGSEVKALEGAKSHIINDHPKLLISVYHNHDDLWKIPKMIEEMCSGYKFYLRYYGNNIFPTETVLIAIYENNEDLI